VHINLQMNEKHTVEDGLPSFFHTGNCLSLVILSTSLIKKDAIGQIILGSGNSKIFTLLNIFSLCRN
jgi:hypothetical protein